MRKIYLFITGVFFTLWVSGQQLDISSLYNINKYEINPAVAGSETNIPLAFSFRKAWVGIKNAPITQVLSSHMQISSMGVGVKMFNATQGPLRRTGMEATYAYHFPINSNNSKLAFGLSGIFYQYFLDKENLELEDPDDLALLGVDQKFMPDAAFGVYYYNDDFFVGFSVYQLFQGRVRFDVNNIADNRQIRHYYFNSGYRLYINDAFTLEPSLLFKFIETGSWQSDINLFVTYMKSVSLGLSYRSGNAVVIQAGYSNKQINVGYAYDLSLSDIKTVSTGSHEIIFVYRFNSFLHKKSQNK